MSKEKSMQELERFTGIGESIRQVLIPGERDRRKARDFVDRFQTIKEELAKLQCSVDFSGHRENLWGNTWVTTVQLTAPKTNQLRIMELIGRSGIQLPDQEPLIRARENTIGFQVMRGHMTMKQLRQEANRIKIDLYTGKGWQGKYHDMVEIKPEVT